MSIRSSESGHIPVLPSVPKQPLSEDPYITLTEVACTVIYGAPLTPGRDGTLRKWVQTACAAKSLWWRIRAPINPSDGSKRFDELTPRPKASDLAASVQQLVKEDPEWVRSRLESISSTGSDLISALEWAAGQPYVFGDHDDELEQMADRFYKNLSSAVAQREIELWGRKSAHAEQRAGDHEVIRSTSLLTPLVHDLEENGIRVAPGQPDPTVAGHIESYVDLKLSARDAKRLVGLCLVQEDQTMSENVPIGPELPTTEGKQPGSIRMTPSFGKIQRALEEVEGESGIDVRQLGPKQRNKRLIDRMEKWGLKGPEIPHERTFRDYFNHGPGKTEKAG